MSARRTRYAVLARRQRTRRELLMYLPNYLTGVYLPDLKGFHSIVSFEHAHASEPFAYVLVEIGINPLRSFTSENLDTLGASHAGVTFVGFTTNMRINEQDIAKTRDPQKLATLLKALIARSAQL